jgi:hypothetical protein
MLQERVEQGVAAAIAAVLPGVLGQRFASGGVYVFARQEVGHADGERNDVAAGGF